MLERMSWSNYWTLIAALTATYYLVLYLLYFRRAKLLKGRANLSFSNADSSGRQTSLSLNELNPGATADHEKLVHVCIDEINAFFENKQKSKPVRSELLFGLKSILQKYPSLQNSDYKEPLTNLVVLQCQHICSIHLSTEELKGIW